MNILEIRKEIFNKLGGLHHISVNNKGWLYLLKEETRNSIMLEGHFVSTEELENIINNNIQTKNSESVLNYYRTTSFMYDLAKQNYFEDTLIFGTPIIRQINHSLKFPGIFRKGVITITGAKITPPVYDIDKYINFYTTFVNKINYKNINQFLSSIAKQHVLFESIHPFEDGNGRTGRILLNYLLISNGLPPVVLKGDQESRNQYISSLEEAESSLIDIFKNNFNKSNLTNVLNTMKVQKFVNLIAKELISSMDKLIIDILKTEKNLEFMPAIEVAKTLNYSKDSIRTLINRGHFIAYKEKGEWMTHPSLYLKNYSKINNNFRI